MRAGVVRGMVSVWIVGAVGCHGGGGDGSAGPPATASAFCQKLEALNIEANIRCYGGTAADYPIFYGESTCPLLDDAVTNHRLAYDATKAAACLDELAKPLACSADVPVGPSCVSSVFMGAVEEGAPCETSYVCRPGSICTTAEGIADSCPMTTCRHAPVVGENCDAPGGPSYCYDGSSCDGHACLAPGKVGAPCGQDGQPFCAYNLYCAVGDPKPTCKRAVENGPCPDGLGCFDFQYCDSTTARCRYRLPLGGDCSADPTGCVTFTACDPTTRRCVEASHLGQLCGNLFGYPFLCQDGVCQADANQVYHCVDPRADGAACANDFECASQLCASGKCAAPPPNDGAPCTDSTLCASGVCSVAGTCGDGTLCMNSFLCTSGVCTEGVCAARAPNGAACGFPGECQSGACSGLMCAAPAADGAACADGTDCVSGHCAAGKCAACR